MRVEMASRHDLSRRLRPWRNAGLYCTRPPTPAQRQTATTLREQLTADHLHGDPTAGQQVILDLSKSQIRGYSAAFGVEDDGRAFHLLPFVDDAGRAVDVVNEAWRGGPAARRPRRICCAGPRPTGAAGGSRMNSDLDLLEALRWSWTRSTNSPGRRPAHRLGRITTRRELGAQGPARGGRGRQRGDRQVS